MKHLFALAMAASFIGWTAGLQITKNGAPNAEIILPESMARIAPADTAARELQLWIEQISGASLPILQVEGKAPVKIALALDPAEYPADNLALKGTDGYAVRTNNARITILASQAGGLLRGVHLLLFKNTDIIWARPNKDFGTVYTHDPNIIFTQADYLDIPSFAQRGWQIEVGREEGSKEAGMACEQWLMRNSSNWSTGGEAIKRQYGYILEYGGGHNLIGLYIRPAKYWDAHPEYFSQLKGKFTDPRTVGGSTQLCFTNKELLEVFKQELEKRVSANPDYSVYRVMIEDNFHMCECKECLKDITLADGTVLKGDAKPRSPEWMAHRNTQFFTWYNELARFMKKNHPGKRLLSFAYFFTEPAPLIPMEDNIDLSYCPIFKNSKADILDPRNKETFDRVDKWMKVTKHLTWREYYGLNVEFPRPIDAIAFRDYAYVNSRGMEKTYSEMVCDFGNFSRWKGDIVWDFSAPYLWNLTNAVWDCKGDCNEYRRQFYKRCFGKAAPEMEKFYSIIETHWLKSPGKSVWSDSAFGSWSYLMRQKGLKNELNAILAEAISKVDKPNGKAMLERLAAALKDKFFLSDVTLKAAKVSVPPPFDPALTQGPWANAPVVPEFDNCPYKTTVKLLHDGKNLYAAMRAERDGVKKLFDPKINYVQIEAFNLFFEIANPATGEPDSVHFLADPVGKTYSSLTENKECKIPWTHQQALDDNGWTIMISVPLEPMAKPLKASVFRRFNKNIPWPLGAYGLKGTAMHTFLTYNSLELME